MQIPLYLYYITRSLLLRGIANSLKLMKAERTNELVYNIETSQIKRSRSTRFYHYQGAGYLVLHRIFDTLPADFKKYSFLDIGCGKGRAVFVAEKKGFDRLQGIELDKDLVDIANANKLKYNKRPSSTIEFLHANALEFNYRNEPTVYFLFNPFNEEVLEEVLDRICIQNKNDLLFIYMNPLYPGAFYKKKFMVVEKLKTRWYTEALVFSRNAETFQARS